MRLQKKTQPSFLSLKERIKVTYRVRIDGDRIYIKIDNGDIFEPISYKAELTASALLEYYNTIDILRDRGAI